MIAKFKLDRDVAALEPFGEGLPQFLILSYQLGNARHLCDNKNLLICDCDCHFLVVVYGLSIISSIVGIMKFLLAGPFPVLHKSMKFVVHTYAILHKHSNFFLICMNLNLLYSADTTLTLQVTQTVLIYLTITMYIMLKNCLFEGLFQNDNRRYTNNFFKFFLKLEFHRFKM